MIHKILKKYWGYDSFRPLQKEIIQSIVEGRDTLGILPTGGGKSITFQVPGLMLEGVVIVVSPLISLMKDQVDNLRKKRIKAVYLHSGMSFGEKRLASEQIYNNKIKFLYISPERLASEFFLQEILRLNVSLIVVDEAHCISQWGYDFRPSYLRISNLRKIFPTVPVLALTASATKEVAEDICIKLSFRKEYNVFRASIVRDNLSYVVRQSEGKLYDIHKILSAVQGSAIVYVRSRKKTREISEYLSNSDIPSTYYHAGLDSLEKEERQNKWMTGEIRVIVATNAFGMGIDKPDVRMVIHYDMPPSLEEYYQEAGRAGRDGLHSYAVLLTSKTDKATLRRRLSMEFPEKGIIRRIYTRLCVFSGLTIGEGYDKTVEFDIAKFCNTFGIEEKVLRPSLRILSQAGYMEFIEELENSSRITITVNRDDLYNVRLSSPIHESILTTILRTYPGVFTDYVFINERRLAFLTQIDSHKIYEILVELSKDKIISYIPRRKTPLLYFPTSMEEEKYISIGKNVYEQRKAVLSKRIEAMINYGFSEDECRTVKLMEYFGEHSKDHCGHCDYCRKQNKNKSHYITDRELMKICYTIFKEKSNGISNHQLDIVFGNSKERVLKILRTLYEDGKISINNGNWILKN